MRRPYTQYSLSEITVDSGPRSCGSATTADKQACRCNTPRSFDTAKERLVNQGLNDRTDGRTDGLPVVTVTARSRQLVQVRPLCRNFSAWADLAVDLGDLSTLEFISS